ncbi:MAG: hypothetical protein DWQ04_10195 [Chloroflexi bacterium]|nr:MAG: hypothetical protein DWQ04_10195 [Chloroflexota bacterium]
MNLCNLNEQFQQLTTILDDFHPVDWDDIVTLLHRIKKKNEISLIPYGEDYLKIFARGTAFIIKCPQMSSIITRFMQQIFGQRNLRSSNLMNTSQKKRFKIHFVS